MPTPDPDKEMAILCARIADDKKARDITLFEVKPLTSITDYMLICTVETSRHGKAIYQEIQQVLKKEKARLPLGLEGVDTGRWILLDYGSVVIHLFCEELRAYYDLEMLWGDAPRVDWTDAA